MPTRRFVVWLFPFSLIVLDIAIGQDFPSKPIRILSPEAGGGVDVVTRLIVPGLAGSLRQQVIVDNRPGVIAAEIAAKAPPDGYTLFTNGSAFWIGALLQKVSYDPVNDFLPITLTAMSALLLVVDQASPQSVKELIAYAKAKPGELNYASSGTGGAPHLAAELFKSMAGVNITRIPYKGNGPALTDLVAGRVQVMFSPAATVTQHVNAGRLRALAVTTPQPFVLFPAIPTLAASGVPGYEIVPRFCIFAPAKTPAPTINRLNREIVRTLNTPDMKARFFNAGVEPVGSSPEQAAAAIKSEMTMAGKLIKDAGIKAD